MSSLPPLPLRSSTVDALTAAGLDPVLVADLVTRALAEDLAGGVDVTSAATIPADRTDIGDLVSRVDGVVAGLPVAAAVFDAVGSSGLSTGDGPNATVEIVVPDGSAVRPGQVLATVRGRTRTLLTAERTALNLLGHLSGVATLTRRWVDAVAGTGAAIRDTRKTLPGLRALEKYAVRCGGGVNHRMSLSDAGLVKDNHVLAAGGVAAAFTAFRREFPGLPVEVECDTLADVEAALVAGADLLLLDNMPTVDMAAAVRLASGTGVRLEASGGLSLGRAREVAETGVDYLSVGALTHSAAVLDIGLDLRPAPPEATDAPAPTDAGTSLED
jgi:nicotinate-nucleotide pyrophosphorylase (carboxylating)